MSSPRDMLTEDEAKKKICPIVSHMDTKIDANKEAYLVNPVCLASGCMLWRWSHQDIDGVPTGFCGAGTLPKYI